MNPKLKEECRAEIERVENALARFHKVGTSHTDRGYHGTLCVNVKSYEFDLPPEFKEADDSDFSWRDEMARQFWEYDLDQDKVYDKHPVTGEEVSYDVPKIYSLGRSSGYVSFDDSSGRAYDAYREYIRESRWGGGSSEPTDPGTALSAFEVWDDVVELNPSDEDIEEEGLDYYVEPLKDSLTEFAEVFERYAVLAEWVVICKEDREQQMRGEWLWALTENENLLSRFDLEHARIQMNGETAKVSWPQHARKFRDTEYVEVVEIEVDVQDLLAALDPRAEEARRILNSGR